MAKTNQIRRIMLPAPTQALLERGLGAGLANVTVYVDARRSAPAAFATSDCVVIAAPFYRPETAWGTYLLAHEFAHVAQKRLGATSPAPCHVVEAEAHVAAACVVAGERYRCRIADHPDVPRFWGEAGHYYTAYMVMLAAGATNQVAADMAALAQMPDQVDVLDATYMGKQYLNTLVPPSPPHPKFATPKQWEAYIKSVQELEKLKSQIRDVQEGIHALTGRSAVEETRLRRQVLESANFPSFEFGLAIHSYGDSFAHRRMNGSGTMYKGPLGHAVHYIEEEPDADTSICDRILDSYSSEGSLFAYLGCSFAKQYLHDAHEPDFIDKRVELYREYGLTLYDIVSAKLPSAKRRLERDALKSKLDEVSRISGEKAQIAKLREIAAAMTEPMNGYRPEMEAANGPLPWNTYRQAHHKYTPGVIGDALGAGASWFKLK